MVFAFGVPLDEFDAGRIRWLRMAASKRRVFLYAIGLFFIGILLYHFRDMFSTGNFSFEKLLFAVRGTRLSLLLLSVALIYVCYAIRTLRWIRFSRYIKRMNFWQVYSMTLAGFASVFLLGRAGEPVRPLLIAQKESVPVSSMFGVYLLERIFDVVSTAVIAGFGLMAFSEMPIEDESRMALIRHVQTAGLVLLSGALCAAIFLIYFRFHGAGFVEAGISSWRSASGWRLKISEIVSGVSHGLQSIRTLADLALAFFYSSAHWILIVVIYLWVAHSFRGQFESIHFKGAMLILAVTMVGSTLQVPGVGGGSQAAAFLAFTQFFGVEKEPALAAAMVLWLVTFVSCSFGGVPLLIREGFSIGKLRHLAEEAPVAAKGPAVAGSAIAKIPDPKKGSGRGAPTA